MGCLDMIAHPVQRQSEKFRCMSDLHWAAYFNSIELIRKELGETTDVNMIDINGNTPLHLACAQITDADCIRILMSYYPNLNSRNGWQETPLHIYIRSSLVDDALLSSFMEMGADPNIADVNGDTPLHLAVGNGAISSIKILLDNGASLFIKNRANLSPMDLAYNSRENDPEVYIQIAKFAIILNICRIRIDPIVLDEMRRNETLQTFNEQCDDELLKLKNTKVGNSYVTLYVILKSSKYAFAKYLRNSEILKWFQNFRSDHFEIFGRRLIQHFEESLERKKAEEQGYPFCRKLFRNLPEVCVQNIMNYLRNEDLYNLHWRTLFR